jgi:hypothetical protein
MSAKKPTKDDIKRANRYLDAIEKAVGEGYSLDARSRITLQEPTAIRVAADRCGVPQGSRQSFFASALRWTGRKLKGGERDQRIGARKNHRTAPEPFHERALTTLRKTRAGVTMADLAKIIEGTKDDARLAVAALMAKGYNIHRHGARDLITLEADLKPAFSVEGNSVVLRSDKNNRFLFGATGDNHLCSRYERLDALNGLYDRMQAAGVQHVFNTGNWIDGEARFNRHELHTHGMDAQLRYLAENYPQRAGMTTYAVTGDDHEGWYAQREGIDIGVRAEQDMRSAGRTDWRCLGYQEAHVILENSNSGQRAVMAVVHPGGGSAYALSYSVQKIIESLDGGEKPAVALYGHYHKLHGPMNIRNVFVMQTGCTMDQSLFMRKKRLEAHVGGIPKITLEQDPRTGAIIGCEAAVVRYFVQGYYQDRFAAPGRAVRKAERRVA